MPGTRVVLDRRAYAKKLFLSLSDAFGIKPNGWGNPEDLLHRQYYVGFHQVHWNHKTRKFWIQPKFHTWRTLVDPCSAFSDQQECECAHLDGLGWVMDDEFSDDGAAMTSFSCFHTPGFTYDLMD
jgi:hypothetical protein